MEAQMRPLGYWLKYIDGRLEANFGRLLAEEDLTRRQWQILDTIASGPHTMAEIDEAAKPFLTAQTPTFLPIVTDFVDRGWVTGEYELTRLGRQTHEAIAAKVRAFRTKVTEGLSDDDYVILVNLLERVATNVTAAR
jgi:DNA-binding MarR family transcriptional regulator